MPYFAHCRGIKAIQSLGGSWFWNLASCKARKVGILGIFEKHNPQISRAYLSTGSTCTFTAILTPGDPKIYIMTDHFLTVIAAEATIKVHHAGKV